LRWQTASVTETCNHESSLLPIYIMNKLNFDFMSMEELERLMKNEGEDKLLREAAMRQLAKRENATFHRSRITRPLIPSDYGF
jgi:hypothetical protein